MSKGNHLLAEVGDGVRDAAPALQAMLDRRGEVRIPGGRYQLGATLSVHSDTSVIAEPEARFRLADGVGRHFRNFMITNANPGNGNANISLQGGFWDANSLGNPRGMDPAGGYFSAPLDRLDYDLMGYTGVAINFTNVRHLAVRNLTIHNPESFFVRIGEVDDFHIENITLSADVIRPNQDGIHVGGFSENGFVRGIRAAGAGVPNDDMVALNADDDVERQLNLGMRRGPIRNVVVEDIEAEDAYTFIRLLSVANPIEDITVRRMRGGYRVHGVNLSNWRFPKGVGHIRRVRLEDIDLAKKHGFDDAPAMVHVSLAVDDVEIRRFHRQRSTPSAVRTLVLDNDQNLTVKVDGRSEVVHAETGYVLPSGDIGEIRFE